MITCDGRSRDSDAAMRGVFNIIASTAPVGARAEFVALQPSADGRLAVGCRFCRAIIPLPDLFPMRHDANTFVDAVTRALKPHWHVPPAPYTAKERERIHVQGIHRRGSLRLRALA